MTWDDLPANDVPQEVDLLVDKRGLASLLGVVPKAIDAHVRNGMPMHGKPRRGSATTFRVPDCIQWLLGQTANPMDEARRRSLEASARKREAEAGRLEDRFVEIATVREVNRDMIAKFQSELESLPSRFPLEVRDLAKIEIAACINRLAEGVAR